MLEVENLSFRYPSAGSKTLKEISFSVRNGEVFGFLGPSGAGKSTTQKILYKLLKGYEGKVEFFGRPLENWGRDFYQHIGVSFELPNHYLKLTAEENLKFFSSFYKKNIKDFHPLLEKVGLENDSKKLVGDYSKGMKMRLNFIRALIHDPDMLFLDEPTSGLDPVNAGRIKNIIRELQGEGKTIFLSTHNMTDADQLCNKVALLHKGEIKAMDTPDALKLRYGKGKVSVQARDQGIPDMHFPLQGLGKNQDFLNYIASNELSTIHSQEATLEEVFIKITGEKLS